MTKDEFSVNELEPERNTNEVVEDTTQMEYTEGSDAAYLNQGAIAIDEKKQEEVVQEEPQVEEYQGPTIKEVLVNSVNPDYQGPTAKEIVVNSVKVDNTKKKNLVGLFVLIIVLVLIGIIVVAEVLSEDKTRPATNYLEGMPEWVDTYNKYLQKEYKDVVAYNIVFVDLDFDDKPEAILNYIKENKTVFDVLDVEENVYVKDLEISNVFLMYSFDKDNVVWYINSSFDDINMNLIDVGKRLNGESDYEINLTEDNLSQFKSNHFTLSYEFKYTKISFRTVEQNLAEAVKTYDTEKEKVNGIIDNYTDGV
jgi:hypothetical protein